MAKNIKTCFSSCESFRCGQRALVQARNKNYCRWADDNCVGAACNYAICIRGRLLSNGVCGLNLKSSNKETMIVPETIGMDTIKIKGKLRRRFNEDDLI